MWDPNAYNQRLFVDGAWQEFAKTYDADGDGNAETLWKPFDTENPTFKWIQSSFQFEKSLSRFAVAHLTSSGLPEVPVVRTKGSLSSSAQRTPIPSWLALTSSPIEEAQPKQRMDR